MVDLHWADFTASKVINERGNKKIYVCASGITPSGSVHIGNFREVITTALVVKSLNKKGKKARFIYSWDDYDRFRKVPKDVPKEFEKYIGMALSEIPDPFKCHKSYAEHFEKEFEDSIKDLNFDIEFIKQSEMYKKCAYSENIRFILNNKEKIIKILNKYREKPLLEDWWPLTVYCEKCKKDFTKILKYDNNYKIIYECDCGFSNEIDFRKKGIVKLVWRVDWPMRWDYENVDFEPGGKDHSTYGGSRDTAKQIFEELYKRKAPVYQVYDFIIIKGIGGKMSSSLGNVINLKDCSEIYEPEIVKWLFARIRPNAEFAISFDLDVMKLYEDFDKCERIYFDKEKIKNEKERLKQKRVYELSCIKIPKKMPKQPSFRHITVLVQLYEGNLEKAIKKYKSKRVKIRAKCAWNWIQKYAPEDMKFKLHEKVSKEIKLLLNEKQKESLKLLAKLLKNKKYDQNGLFNEFYNICEKIGINNTEFFKGAYLALIGKEKGPKLANFILIIGKNKVIKLLKGV